VGTDRGAVTVEAAIALCAVLVVVATAVAGLASVIGYLRCTDAAREAVRLVSRGDRERAEQAVGRLAPRGARLVVRVDGDEVRVEVTAPSPGDFLTGLRLRAEAYSVLEPGTDLA